MSTRQDLINALDDLGVTVGYEEDDFKQLQAIATRLGFEFKHCHSPYRGKKIMNAMAILHKLLLERRNA